MLDIAVDVAELSALVSDSLGRACRLTPLDVRCTYPVFRGEVSDGSRVFVKVGTHDEWRRSVALLKDIGNCGLFARFLVETPVDFHGHAVFITEWREASLRYPEDMTDAQVDRFVAGCVKLSRTLQAARDFAPIAASPLAPERLRGVLADYVRRHPLAGRFLRDLAELPVESRTFGNRPLAVVHGDFHAKNFGFSPDGELSGVFDFDQLTQGLPCWDLTNALVERFSCLSLSAKARERLANVTRRAISASPWPADDFAVCCNILRLRFAVRRLEKHPNSAWVALDAWRRDRNIRAFLHCL